MLAEPASRDAGPSLTAAHARLLADKSLQFELAPAPLPRPSPWAEVIARLIEAVAPFLQYVFWAGVIAIVGGIVFYIVREIVLRPRGDRIEPPAAAAPDLAPAPERAHALLADADRLAAEGRYAEAVHLLLLRSVEDIDAKRPATVRPSMTSRDIAELSVLPEAARTAFTRVAEVVERSFFGGREVDAAGYRHCRDAYEAFAFPKAWT